MFVAAEFPNCLAGKLLYYTNIVMLSPEFLEVPHFDHGSDGSTLEVLFPSGVGWDFGATVDDLLGAPSFFALAKLLLVTI
jgi:hypothetical protein